MFGPKANRVIGVSLGIAMIVVFSVALAGCGTSNLAERPTCPPLTEYSEEEQSRAARDLGLLPADSPVRHMMDRYGVLRGKCRVE